MKTVEKEFKNLLTEEEFNCLQQAYHTKLESPIVQTNIYFDTIQHDFKKNKSAFRIRYFQDSPTAELTLKIRMNDIEVAEFTEYIPKKELFPIQEELRLPSQLQTIIQQYLHITPSIVYKIGELTTHRQEYHYEGNILTLDKSYYHNSVDYELELEVNDVTVGRKTFLTLLQQFSIPVRATQSKIARAVQKNKG